jgi:hypothetical protein
MVSMSAEQPGVGLSIALALNPEPSMDGSQTRDLRFDELPPYGLARHPGNPLQQIGGVNVKRDSQLDQRVDAGHPCSPLQQADGRPVQVGA